MNRGSIYGPRPKRCRGICFNEAPIHESGKFAGNHNPLGVRSGLQ